MSKTGAWVLEAHTTHQNVSAALPNVAGRPLSDISPRDLSALVWAARLYLRNDYCTELFNDDLASNPLAPETKAEIMRLAREAEQTADYEELNR